MAPTTATRWTLSDDRLERGRQRVAVGHLLAAVPALGGLLDGTRRFGLGRAMRSVADGVGQLDRRQDLSDPILYRQAEAAAVHAAAPRFGVGQQVEQRLGELAFETGQLLGAFLLSCSGRSSTGSRRAPRPGSGPIGRRRRPWRVEGVGGGPPVRDSLADGEVDMMGLTHRRPPPSEGAWVAVVYGRSTS